MTKNTTQEPLPSESGPQDTKKRSSRLKNLSEKLPALEEVVPTPTMANGRKNSTSTQSPRSRGRTPKTLTTEPPAKKSRTQAKAGADPDAQEVHVDEDYDDYEPESNVVFTPNPGPQTEFFASSEQEVLYGGAAGGGKSYALLADPLRYMLDRRNSALLLRRTTEELRELKWKSQELYPSVYPDIKWSERNQAWTMPNGARLWMSFVDRDQDVLRYQGQAFNWIGFDELTQWPSPFQWDYLRSRLRTTGRNKLPLFMRATANPGGPGGWWVKKMFIDCAPWNTSFPATDIETGEVFLYPQFDLKGRPHPKAGQPLFYRRFIPAHLYDNPHLADDGMYEANLMSLPEHQRKRLLEGNWDLVEGAAFPEFNRDIHVIEPFAIPRSWKKFRAMDYGYGSYTGVVWFAVHPSGQLIVYRDLEISKVHAFDMADVIKEIEDEANEVIAYGVLDFSIGADRGQRGPTLVEQLQRNNLRWRPADRGKGSRVAGKNMIHRLLQVDDFTGEPNLVFFSTCKNCLAQIPIIPLDPANPEDVDTKARDHIYDALRYGVMSRPRPGFYYGEEQFWTPTAPKFEPVDETFGY